MENSMEVPERVKNRPTMQPLLGTSEEIQNTNSKRYTHSCVLGSVIYNRQVWNPPKCSTDE